MVRPPVTSRAVRVCPNTRSPAPGNATATKTKKKENKKTETKKKNRKGKIIISKDAAHGGLSHFVAPLYVAPSTTPGNAKPTSESNVALNGAHFSWWMGWPPMHFQLPLLRNDAWVRFAQASSLARFYAFDFLPGAHTKGPSRCFRLFQSSAQVPVPPQNNFRCLYKLIS